MENNITVAISHFVKQGKEEAFESALRKVIRQAETFEGYGGLRIIKPNSTSENEYLLLARFDNEKNYKAWENSDIRTAWAEELKNYIRKESQIRYQEGLEFWFSVPEAATPPTKWKMAVLTWVVIYPLILIFSTLASIYLDFFHLFIRLMIVSMILVTAMTYLIMPRVTKLFSKWIFK